LYFGYSFISNNFLFSSRINLVSGKSKFKTHCSSLEVLIFNLNSSANFKVSTKFSLAFLSQNKSSQSFIFQEIIESTSL